ncbi:MAG: hypothetical protein HYW25_02595 [Candidatus Aenigmarchaeota archaeon]|nr:hypothetical protein [Candidatus Aenigmarchaeota archaeon]
MQVREYLLTEYISASTKDPYQLSHALIHAAQKFGHVIEKENSLESSGPRTSSKVQFSIKKQMDKFSVLFIDIYAEGDSLSESLNVTFSATITSDIPEARGLVSGLFHQQYRDRIYGNVKKNAGVIAKKAFLEFQEIVKGTMP